MLLIVEDCEPLLRVLVRRAGAHGGVCGVGSVREAIAVIERGEFVDAAIVDIALGDGSGFEVLEHLVAAGMDVPALVLTGLRDEATIRRAQLLGAQYLPKPLESENLDAFLEQAAERRYTCFVRHTARRRRLSPRETEALVLVATGTPRSALAEQMGLAPSTVKTILARMLVKSGAVRLDELATALQASWRLGR